MWVPEIGSECEYKLSGVNLWERVSILFISNSSVVFEVDRTNKEYAFDLKSAEFRPIKTQKEINRDAFIGDCVRVTRTMADDSIEMFGNMFNAGFTAPKGDL